MSAADIPARAPALPAPAARPGGVTMVAILFALGAPFVIPAMVAADLWRMSEKGWTGAMVTLYFVVGFGACGLVSGIAGLAVGAGELATFFAATLVTAVVLLASGLPPTLYLWRTRERFA